MDKTIENLGTLTGKVLVFGGIYSNLQALKALIGFAEENKIPPENCICTGDIVGYCAQPDESVLKLKDWKAKSILGNVEIQLNEGADDCGCDFEEGSRCDSFSQNWYAYARQNMSKAALDFISKLPDHIKFLLGNKRINVVHGSYFKVSEFIFKSTDWEIKQPNFDIANSDIIIAGHSGLPFHDSYNGKLWLNPGVIGMPANDGAQSVWFALLEEIDGKVNFKYCKLEYDYQLASDLMVRNKLPLPYAKTLLTGIWDNMEILPTAERNLQGRKIVL